MDGRRWRFAMGRHKRQPGDEVAKLVAAGALVGSVLAFGTACGTSGSDPAPSEASAAPIAAASPSAPAGPEHFSGIYKIEYEDGSVDTWSVTSCGPACADVNQQMIGLVPSTINGQAHLEGGTWTFLVSRFDAVTCEDGSTLEGTSTWTWDETTLEGSLTATQMFEGCDKPAGFETDGTPFTLTRTSSGAPPPGFQSS